MWVRMLQIRGAWFWLVWGNGKICKFLLWGGDLGGGNGNGKGKRVLSLNCGVCVLVFWGFVGSVVFCRGI